MQFHNDTSSVGGCHEVPGTINEKVPWEGNTCFVRMAHSGGTLAFPRCL